MSDSESDSSIATDEMNNLKADVDDAFEKEKPPPALKEELKVKRKNKTTDPGLNVVEVTGEEIMKIKKKDNKKVKKKVHYASEDEGEPSNTSGSANASGSASASESEPKKPKKKGRPPTPIEEKLAKKVITKEKIIYMIEGQDGTITRRDPNKISLRELKKMELEDQARAKEVELGRKLKRLKDGSAKVPKPRSEKQIQATIKMREALTAKKKARKDSVVQEKEVKQVAKEKVLKDTVKESIREVVQEPHAPPPRVKSAREEYLDFFS